MRSWRDAAPPTHCEFCSEELPEPMAEDQEPECPDPACAVWRNATPEELAELERASRAEWEREHAEPTTTTTTGEPA